MKTPLTNTWFESQPHFVAKEGKYGPYYKNIQDTGSVVVWLMDDQVTWAIGIRAYDLETSQEGMIIVRHITTVEELQAFLQYGVQFTYTLPHIASKKVITKGKKLLLLIIKYMHKAISGLYYLLQK